MSDEVLVERRGAVQVITINRPEARNALNGAVAAGIRDAADELDADGALRVGVLTGVGGTFSSGMDLKAFLKGETPSFPGRGLCGITQTPPRKPLIGAAEGWALAGGFELSPAIWWSRVPRPGSACPRSSAGWWPAPARRCCWRGGYRGPWRWR